jgi:hypothetical protein
MHSSTKTANRKVTAKVQRKADNAEETIAKKEGKHDVSEAAQR